MDEEEVGAIDTSSGDESAGLNLAPRASAPPTPDDSGAAPVIDTGDWQREPSAGDNSGAMPAIDTAQKPQDEAALPKTGPNGPIARGVKRIASYLMGEGAADPQALNVAGAQVDPQGQMSADDRNLLAVQKAAEQGGPEAAWKLLQANRVSYNAKQAFAYTALNGTAQKPPDLNAAIDAANKAASHVLDGSSVQFAPAEGGVTATVKAAGSEQPQVVNLSMDQFRKYLNVGGAGQYDKLMQHTLPKTLTGLSRANGGITRLDQMRPLPKPAAPADNEPAPLPAEETNFGKTPSTLNLSGSNKVQYGSMDQPATEDASLDQRAQRIFPGISQGQQAEAWKNAEMQRQEQNQNKVDVAVEGRIGKERVASITGGSRERVAETKAASDQGVAGIKAEGWRYATDGKKAAAQIAADAKLAHDGNVDARARLETARKAIATKRLTMEGLTPEEKELEKQMTAGGAASATPAPRQQQAPQQQAPQRQGSSQQPPVPGAKLYKGQWYTRGPNGESVPVQ